MKTAQASIAINRGETAPQKPTLRIRAYSGFLCVLIAMVGCNVLAARSVAAQDMSLPVLMEELYYGPQTTPETYVEPTEPALKDDAEDPQRGQKDGWRYNFGVECNSCAGGIFIPSFAETPERIRGIWAAPDCAEVNDMLYQTKTFSTWMGPDKKACMEIFMNIKDYGATYKIETSLGEILVQVTNDGLMQTGVIDPEVGFDEKKATDPDMEISDLVEAEGREYAQCSLLPPMAEIPLMKTAMGLMDRLDDMVSVCNADGNPPALAKNQACQDWLFAEADKDKSGLLKRDEVEDMTFRALLTYELLAVCASMNQFEKRNFETILESADRLLNTLDLNKDFMLSKDELSSLYRDAVLNPRVMENLVALQEIFPFLRQDLNIFIPENLNESAPAE